MAADSCSNFGSQGVELDSASPGIEVVEDPAVVAEEDRTSLAVLEQVDADS